MFGHPFEHPEKHVDMKLLVGQLRNKLVGQGYKRPKPPTRVPPADSLDPLVAFMAWLDHNEDARAVLAEAGVHWCERRNNFQYTDHDMIAEALRERGFFAYVRQSPTSTRMFVDVMSKCENAHCMWYVGDDKCWACDVYERGVKTRTVSTDLTRWMSRTSFTEDDRLFGLICDTARQGHLVVLD